jgi:hypothetical protein
MLKTGSPLAKGELQEPIFYVSNKFFEVGEDGNDHGDRTFLAK